MGIITTMLRETAVYWAPDGTDDFGRPTTEPPIEISVRWQDIVEEFIDAEGDKQMSTAKVFTGIDVELEGVLFLGTLADIIDAVDPKNNPQAWEIRRFDRLPNLRATEFLRTAYL